MLFSLCFKIINAIDRLNQNLTKPLFDANAIKTNLIAKTDELVIQEIIPIRYLINPYLNVINKVIYSCKICKKTTNELEKKCVYYFKFVNFLTSESYIILVCSRCLKCIEHVYILKKKYIYSFENIFENIYLNNWDNNQCNGYICLPKDILNELKHLHLNSNDVKESSLKNNIEMQFSVLFDINLITMCFKSNEKINDFKVFGLECFYLGINTINEEQFYDLDIKEFLESKSEIYKLLWLNMGIKRYFEKMKIIDYIRYVIENDISKEYINLIKKSSKYYANVELNIILLHALFVYDCAIPKLNIRLDYYKGNENIIKTFLKQYNELSKNMQNEIEFEFYIIRNNENDFNQSINWLLNTINEKRKYMETVISRKRFASEIKMLENKTVYLI